MVKHVIISGRVQGVGFRHFTRKNAEALGLKGWVKNLDSGNVEAVFEGDEKEVAAMLERCKKGPAASYVKDITAKEIENEEEHLDDFEVRY